MKKPDTNKVFILNASPLILLGKAGLLPIVSSLAKTWIVPEGVISEFEAKRPIDPYLSDLAKNATISRKWVQSIHPLVAAWDLGRGESEVITLAMQNNGAKVVLDDLQARKCAKLFQIPLVGTLGLLVMAKKAGHIPVVRPEINKLVKVGLHADFHLLEEIYKEIGE